MTSSSRCGLLTASSAHITRKWAAITDTLFTSYKKCRRKAQQTSIIKCENGHAFFWHFNSNPPHAPRLTPHGRYWRLSSPSSCPLLFFCCSCLFNNIPDYYSQYRCCWWWSDTPDSLLLHLQKRNKQIKKRKQKPFGRLTCTITDPIVCVRGSMCESDERGRRGVEGWPWKRGQDNDSSSFFYYIISLKDTPHGDGEEKWRDSITQQEIWTWAVYLAWPIGWSISKQEVNAAYWPELQEVDLSRKREALRSLLLDIWMDIICFLHVHSYCFHLRWLSSFAHLYKMTHDVYWSLFVWLCVLLAFLSVIPSAVHLQIRLVED